MSIHEFDADGNSSILGKVSHFRWCLTPLSTIFQLYIVTVIFFSFEETGVPLLHNVVSRTPRREWDPNSHI